jgi:hypothetical protein
MKPKTKFHHTLVEVQKKLPDINEAQLQWASIECLMHKAVRLKSGKITCLDCATEWIDKTPLLPVIDNVCPGCNTTVKLVDTRTRVFKDAAYFNIIVDFKGYQVIRLYMIKGSYSAGKPVDVNCFEVGQIWITPEGKHGCFGYYAGGFYYSDQWQGSFELRNETSVSSYNFGVYRIYPKIRTIQKLKRNGFKKSFHGLTPYNLFKSLLTNSKMETLIKANQFALLNYFDSSYNKVDDFWSEIKICIRNNYVVKDASTWADYLGILRFFNRDTRNIKYVCPDNLKKEHDRYVAKKREFDRREDLRKKRLKADEEQAEYVKLKYNYFGLEFTDNELTVKVLESVREFMEEGDVHGHCVFASSYYKKPESLIFSARVNGVPIETVEVSLSKLQIVQSRGKGNRATEYNTRIRQLITMNLMEIKKRVKVNKQKLTNVEAA